MEKLPKYEITIDKEYQTGDEELGMDMIAFTSNPAIIVKGVAFKAQPKQFFADEKKYRITAPIMIPMDIYRKDDDMGEYEVTFTEEVVDRLFTEFMSDLKNRDIFNLEHSEEKVPAYILEAWKVDNPKEDKAYSTFGIEVPKGAIMVTTQITDKDYYNELVKNERVGYSIEGFLGLKNIEEFKKEQLNKYSMKLPDGEHLIDGKVYVVTDGEVTEIKEEVAQQEEQVEPVKVDEPTVEPVAEVVMEEDEEENPKEEEMAEEPKSEEPVEVEAEVNPETDSEAIMAIVQPMIEAAVNEVLQVVADLKNEISGMEEGEPMPEGEMMSAHSMFHKYQEFINKNQNG